MSKLILILAAIVGLIVSAIQAFSVNDGWVGRRVESRLANLDYLVRRNNEVLLSKGEVRPADGDSVYVSFREKKDPRDIRVLDPACGSGHFLLYAYDLLLVIYEEGWADEAAPRSEKTGQTLREQAAPRVPCL